ncbi:MAG: hypothetical protein JSS36_01285 [Proteobacteria bacterium]|nr:hypothetical protein [Pseudomonadota bacterium]
MTRLIKAASLPHDHDLSALAGALALIDGAPASEREPEPIPAAEPDALGEALARLQAAEARLAELETAVEAARREGEQQGRLAAEMEYEEDRSAALERLAAMALAAEKALIAFGERAEMAGLSIAIAALDKLFGPAEARREAMADLIRRQRAELGRAAVIRVEVARADFPDTREVAQLAAEVGIERAAILVRDDLDQGACELRLTLGAMECGLDQQWGVLRELLTNHEAADSGVGA